MPRSRLPRSAKGLRPGVIKAPAQPSLLCLIQNDAAHELQKRVCGTSLLTLHVSDPEFWQTQWPHLLRQSCEHVSQSCLKMLLMLTPAWNQNPPPLPAQTVSWLLKGFETHSSTSCMSMLGDSCYDQVASRLERSPIKLSSEDGLRLVRLGGCTAALRTSRSFKDGAFRGVIQSDAFQTAWRKWCASLEHQKQTLSLVSTKILASHCLKIIEEVTQALPAHRLSGFLNDLGDSLQGSWAINMDNPDQVQAMLGWQRMFAKSGWPMTHPLWEDWGMRLCQALEAAPFNDALGAAWTNATLVERGGQAGPLPGWRWTPAMREGLVRTRVHLVKNLLAQHQSASPTSLQALEQAGAFFQQTLQTEKVLAAWGRGDASSQRHLDACLQSALGKRWEEGFEEVAQVYGDGGSSLRTHWAAWKGRHLELDWSASEAVAPARPRPRM